MYYFYIVLLFIYTHHSFEMQKTSRQTCTLNLPNDTYFLFKVGVHNYFYRIFISNYNISVQFVEIKCAEHDYTLQTVNTEFETTTSRFTKIVTNTCFHHVYNINTSRTTWKHCHVYSINRGCPRGHMLVTN